MKTRIRSSKAAKKVPPFSALLLFLAVLFSIAAWRVAAIKPNSALPEPGTRGSAPAEEQTSFRRSPRAAYEAHRHQAVSLGDSSATARAVRRGGGRDWMATAL